MSRQITGGLNDVAEQSRWSGCRMAGCVTIRTRLVRHHSARAFDMNRDTKSHLIWGILGQIIIVVLAAVALDGALSCYALLASSISYWVLFAVMTRRVRSRLDTLFLRFGIIILFCACW